MTQGPNGLNTIRDVLKLNPRGMTIIDISTEVGINRNTTAKHLDVLLASGQVEVQIIGPAKVYFIAERVPLSSLMNSTSDGIIVLDGNLTVVQVNDSALELLGIERSNLVSKPVGSLEIPMLSDLRIINHLVDSLKGKAHSEETKFQIDDRIQCFSIKLIPTSFNTGTPAVTIIFEDISSRKAAEEKINSQREFLEKVLESLTHPFYVIDAKDYSVVMTNTAANFEHDIINPTCHALTHLQETPCTGEDHPCPLLEVKKTKAPVVVEHIHHDVKTGTERVHEVHGYPIFDDDGNVIQMIEYNLDITDRRNAVLKTKASESKIQSLTEREIIHSSIVKAAPIGVGFVENRVIKWASDTLLDMLGYEHKDLIGKNARLLYKTDREFKRVGRKKYKQIEENGVGVVETLFKRKDGKLVDVLLSSAPVDPTDLSKSIAFTVLDISDRKSAKEGYLDNLRVIEKQYISVFDAMRDGVIIINENLEIVFVNETFRKQLQSLKLNQKVLGKAVHKAFSFLPIGVVNEYESIFEGGEVNSSTFSFSLKGKVYVLEMQRFPIIGSDSKMHIVSVVRNLTEQV
ncbi:MAG: PAS domain-containing protein [Candidatus Thorarchaeota archaeon]|jgi:PAS domain S-box-containing protein